MMPFEFTRAKKGPLELLFVGAHADDIKTEVAAQNRAGDRRTYYVDTTGWLEPADYTDRVHPNAGAAAKVVETLRKFILLTINMSGTGADPKQ